jgi:membrane protease YdiL (CAAX protease family)
MLKKEQRATMEPSLPSPESTPALMPALMPPSSTYVAPWWHTALLVLFMLTFSALGSAGHPGLDHSSRMQLYISTVVMEWLMVLYIVWGLHLRKRTTLGNLIGGRWKTPEDFLLDIATAIGFWIVAAIVLAAVGLALGMNNGAHLKDAEHRIGSLLPDGRTEMLTWVLVCVTAGFCEEVIFRGYFQAQFAALLKSAWGGIALQALIFGGSHAYEGWQKMVQIAVFGFLFGVLAYWRKSLRPGMIAHFAQDSLAGLLGRWAIEHADKVMPK